MKKRILVLLVGFLLIGVNLYAADGDLIVEGNVGIGTTSPSDKVVIQLSGDMSYGNTAVSGLVLKAPDSQHTPALTFIGGGPNGGDIGKIAYDSGNDLFNFFGGKIGLPVGSGIRFSNMSLITVPTNGNGLFHFDSSVNLETTSDNTGKVIIPYGNLGIGTTNPGTKLEIAIDGASEWGSALLLNQNAIGNGDGPKIEFYKTMASPAAWTVGILNGWDVGAFSISYGGGSTLNTGWGTQMLTITPTSNVGIGTTTPIEKLEITGAVKVADTASPCDTSHEGTIKYVRPHFYGCDGTNWKQLD